MTVPIDWIKLQEAKWNGSPMPVAHACNCVGRQRGEPKCPCQMAGVIKRDGRWIQTEVDLGPAA